MASWLVRSSPEQVVRVRALAGDIVLCSWARHLTLTVPLSTQVYKWVSVNFWGKPNKLRGNDLRWTSILSRGSRNTPSRFMLQKPGISSGRYGPLGSKASFILHVCEVLQLALVEPAVIDHFTVVCSVTCPLNESGAESDLVVIQSSLLLLCKSSDSNANKRSVSKQGHL